MNSMTLKCMDALAPPLECSIKSDHRGKFPGPCFLLLSTFQAQPCDDAIVSSNIAVLSKWVRNSLLGLRHRRERERAGDNDKREAIAIEGASIERDRHDPMIVAFRQPSL